MGSNRGPGATLRAISNGFFFVLKILIVALLALMVAMVFGNVVLRYAFNSGIVVSEELSRWCLVWMTFAGALVALHERKHLGVTIVLDRMSAPLRRISLTLAHVLMIYCCYLLLLGSWAQTVLNTMMTGTVVPLSMAWFYGTGVVFSVVAIVILLGELYRIVVLGDDTIGIVSSDGEVELDGAEITQPPSHRAAEKDA